MKTTAISLASTWILALAAASTGCADPDASAPMPPGGAQSVERHTFHSAALGVDKAYYVHLPADYASSDRRYPVVYLLHSLTGSESSWVDLGAPETAARLDLPAIVVMPDGDDGFYVDWPGDASYEACAAAPRPFDRDEAAEDYCVQQPRYEDYVVRDLVAEVDGRFRTIPDADARALGGASMGGFGALSLTMRHPDVFRSAASHSGVVSLLYAGPYPFDPSSVSLHPDPAGRIEALRELGGWFEIVFGRDLEHWQELDPAHLAQTASLDGIDLYLDAGTADEFGLHAEAAHLHHVLSERSIPHGFALVEGAGHDPVLWATQLEAGLHHHLEHFERAGVYDASPAQSRSLPK